MKKCVLLVRKTASKYFVKSGWQKLSVHFSAKDVKPNDMKHF